MQNVTQARPYAEAAFEQAREENKLKEWSEMLRVLGLVVSDSQMQKVLDNPRVGCTALQDIVLGVCGDYLSDTGKNFVKVITENKRLLLAPQIFLLFEQKRKDIEGIADVEVISAYPMDSEQKRQVSDAMSKRLGKKIEITTRVDESLIGGVVIRAGDSVIDASMRGRLKQLGNVLSE